MMLEFYYVIIFCAAAGFTVFLLAVLKLMKYGDFKKSVVNLFIGIFLMSLAAWGYPRYLEMKKIMEAPTAAERQKAYEESHLNK